MSWRDHLKVHPAAELFPLMSEPELRELGEDIKKNGLLSPIIIGDDGGLVDGRNRLDAIELLGMEFEFVRAKYGPTKGRITAIHSDDFDTVLTGAVRTLWDFKANPYDFVISANLHRRHLTAEQKRDLIAKMLKAKPEASNRQIATQVKADHKTVAAVRNDLESVGEIPHLEKTVGADGKQYKSRPKKKAAAPPRPEPEPEPVEHRATGSAEISADDRRAYYAETENPEPAEPAVDEVDRRVSCVTNTILRHIEGLSRSDAERFFTALRDRLDDLEREQLRDEVAEGRSEHEIPGDLSVPDFLRRAPA